jgi:hypothetical protein
MIFQAELDESGAYGTAESEPIQDPGYAGILACSFVKLLIALGKKSRQGCLRTQV